MEYLTCDGTCWECSARLGQNHNSVCDTGKGDQPVEVEDTHEDIVKGRCVHCKQEVEV